MEHDTSDTQTELGGNTLQGNKYLFVSISPSEPRFATQLLAYSQSIASQWTPSDHRPPSSWGFV